MSNINKFIIAGSREISVMDVTDLMVKLDILKEYCPNMIVICGMCEGVDMAAKRWADANKITVWKYPVLKADWDKYGKGAGPRRNRQMAAVGDILIVMQRNNSSGSASMIKEAKLKNLPIWKI